jgi:hypothetical protein
MRLQIFQMWQHNYNQTGSMEKWNPEPKGKTKPDYKTKSEEQLECINGNTICRSQHQQSPINLPRLSDSSDLGQLHHICLCPPHPKPHWIHKPMSKQPCRETERHYSFSNLG